MKRLIVTVLMAVSMPLAYASDFDALELEPCINGGVSASGLYATQEQENIAKRQAPTPSDDVGTTTYSSRVSR